MRMDEKELMELAKKFGDNYTYGKIVEVLRDKFIDKKKVIDAIEKTCGPIQEYNIREKLGLKRQRSLMKMDKDIDCPNWARTIYTKTKDIPSQHMVLPSHREGLCIESQLVGEYLEKTKERDENGNEIQMH